MVNVKENPAWDLNLCEFYVLCEELKKSTHVGYRGSMCAENLLCWLQCTFHEEKWKDKERDP